MLPKFHNPQVEAALASLTIDELREEGIMAVLNQCDYTANVRSQIGSVLDIYRDFQHTDAYHRIVHEAVLARTAATVMYSVLPFTTVEALKNINADDKEILESRVDEVAAHWTELVPAIADRVAQSAAYIKGKFGALVDAIVGTAAVTDEVERMQIIQNAFAAGEYHAACDGTSH